ncbi:MAG: DUF1588 domain-containing protein, partial [Pseudomonadota bacterium]
MNLLIQWQRYVFLFLMASMLIMYQNCGQFIANQEGGSLLSSTGQEKFQCDSSAIPNVSNTRRLTKREYVNTLYDLGGVFSVEDQVLFREALEISLQNLPDDSNEEGRFREQTNFVSQQLIDAFINIGITVGEFVQEQPARLRQFVGTCAEDGSIDRACVQEFSDKMGKKIYRRPLTANEIEQLFLDIQDFNGPKAQWLVTRVLSNPQFFMHIENTRQDLGNGLYEIDDFSLASRVSYFLLGTMPDDELLQAAEEGRLRTPAGLREQVMRLDSPAHRPALSSLMYRFFEQWLRLDEVSIPDPESNTLMMNFAAGATLSQQSLKSEIESMIDYFTFEVPGDYSDLLTNDISFAKNSDLANVYQVPVWNGNTNQLVRFPEGQRSGLLTRAAFLVNQGSLSKPIQRGIHIRHDILCDPLPPPPAEIFDRDPLPFNPDFTTRERVTLKTSDQSCMGCHSKINDTGFALEKYDSFGRFRLAEKIFDPQS